MAGANMPKREPPEQEEGELVAISAEVIDTGGPDEDDEDESDDEEDDVEEAEQEEEEEEEEDPDPSQLLEINHEGEEEEEWDGVKKEEGDESSSRPLGLLEQALKRPLHDPLPEEKAGQQSSSPPARKRPLLQHHSSDAAAAAKSTYPTVTIEAHRFFGDDAGGGFGNHPVAAAASAVSRPRSLCPICGDRANGIHYGVYTCEGCKNFFKRSVVAFSTGKPYICRGSQNCKISLFEDDGVTRRRTRCQSCRYKACLDAGMQHTGRNGGRQQKVNLANKFHSFGGNSTSPMAEEYDHNSSSNHYADNGVEEEELEEEEEEEDGLVVPRTLQIERLNAQRRQIEVELLQSRVRELEGSLAEKDCQLEIQRGQIANLQRQVEVYEGKSKASSNGDIRKSAFPTVAQFGNGSVTITSIGRRSELGKK